MVFEEYAYLLSYGYGAVALHTPWR